MDVIEVLLFYVIFEDVGDSIRLVWREIFYVDFDKKELIRVIKCKYCVKFELIIKDGRFFIDIDYFGIEKYIVIYI